MKLTPIGDLLKSSLRIYFKRENLIYFTKMALSAVAFPLLVALPLAVVAIVTGGISVGRGVNLQNMVGLGVVVGVGSIIAFVVLLWVQVATYVAAIQAKKGQILSVKETYKVAWPKLPRFFLVGLAVGLIVVLGFLLLIIPGIIFAVWFSFSGWLVVAEGKGIGGAISKSKALVSGYFWPILGRYGVFFAISFLLQIAARYVPLGGAIVLLLFSPYFVLLHYLLYEDVKAIHS